MGALATRRYSPGMVIGLVLILPLTIGVWALTIGVGRTEPIAFLVAAVVSPLKEIHAARPSGERSQLKGERRPLRGQHPVLVGFRR